MRYSLILPSLLLGLAGCVPQPTTTTYVTPATTTTTYTPATSTTVLNAPTGYQPGYQPVYQPGYQPVYQPTYPAQPTTTVFRTP
jgi:hypothetical protein